MLSGQKRNTGISEKKSIYDFLSAKKDIGREVQKIAELFESTGMIWSLDSWGHQDEIFTPEEVINNIFLSWKGRNLYLTPDELKEDMEIAEIQQIYPNELQFVRYLEYVINMIQLFARSGAAYLKQQYTTNGFKIDWQQWNAMKDNISLILSQLNLMLIKKSPEVFILIPKDPAITEAADSIEKPDVKLAILEYNHITNRDNLTGKQKILHILAKDFEPKRVELEKTNEGKNIASDLGFLFNSLDIRHNNTEGLKAFPAIQSMSEKDLLTWYDRTYRLYLTAVLLTEYSEQKDKITALKKAVNPK